MNYTIRPKAPGAYEIEIGSNGGRCLVDVAQTPDQDLLVQVFGLTDPPAHVLEGEILTHTVGYWWVPLETGPDAVAEEVADLLKTLHRAA